MANKRYSCKKGMKDNPLFYFPRFFESASNNIFVKTVLYYIAISSFLQLIALIYCIFQADGYEFMITFAVILFSNIHICITVPPFLYYKKELVRRSQELMTVFWPWDYAGHEVERKILYQKKLVGFRLLLGNAACFTIALAFVPFRSIDYNKTMHIVLAGLDYFNVPLIPRMVSVILYFTWLLFVALLIPTYSYIFIYFVCHLRLQFYLLGEHMKRINSNFIIEKYELLIDNEEYQNVIYERLTEAIKQHIVLTRCGNSLFDFFSPVMFFHIGSGIAMGTTLLYITLIKDGASDPIAMMLFIGGLIIIAYYYFEAGEICQNIVSNLNRTALKSQWNTFNVKNRKCLLLFLMNSRKPIHITGFGIFTVNFELLIWMVHKVVSMLSAILTVEEKKKMQQ